MDIVIELTLICFISPRLTLYIRQGRDFYPSKKRGDWENLDLMGKGKSEWNVNSFQKNLMKLKGACQA